MKEMVLKTESVSAKIYIGEDVIEKRLPALTHGQKNFVVTDSNVYALYEDFFKEYFSDTATFVLTAGEEYKTFTSLGQILEKMSTAGLTRTSRVFAVGGGVVGDIGGLSASLYMRGISCVQIPTTLLAQVDSSVGGKTAVDLNGIKNIVGAFYQPMEVLVSPTFLKTLPKRELKCGLGEIVKYCALDKAIFEKLESADCALDDLAFLQSLIEDCIAYKAGVVSRDEKETGERKCLNVGHTTGHAIELATGLSHGECVLYGTWLETQMAIEQGVCEAEYGKRLLAILEKAIGVQPVSTPDFENACKHLDKAKSDKKNLGDGKIQMAVAKSLGQWTTFALPFDGYVAGVKRWIKAL